MDTLDLHGTSKGAVQYAILKAFWSEFGRDGNKHPRSAQPKAPTLERLKDIGDFIVLRNNTPFKNKRDRLKFEHIKAGRHKFKTHAHCFACGAPAEVRHHIIWIKNGGLNSKKNLVSLCKPCHAFIHPWMKEKTPKG